jgi:hypothetical protein
MFILAHGFSPWFLGPIAFVPMVKQYIKEEVLSRGKLDTSWKAGSRERERERRERGQSSNISFKSPPKVTYFP